LEELTVEKLEQAPKKELAENLSHS
jgi:hypothetical protein